MSTDSESWHQKQACVEMNRFRLEKALRGEDDGYRINLNQLRHQKPPAPPGVAPALNQRLDVLTKDRNQSERLVDSVAQRFPGKRRTWCTERAIRELERDRL